VVFPDAEDSIWTWDEPKRRAVLPAPLLLAPARPQHRQPGVRDEIAKIAGFWLELGVDGFRVDAVPYLIETGGIDDEDATSTRTDCLKELRRS
jgi:glycosidase